MRVSFINKGKRLRQYRQERGLTLVDVAERVNETKGNISKIENNKCGISDEHAIAILVLALDFTPTEAQQIIKEWILEEVGE